MRLRNIDLFKGLLIILVILGHMLQGEIGETIWRKTIYSFHMPLFIGICGFLYNSKKTFNLSISGLFKKYLFRIILPWIIAVIGYYVLFLYQDTNINFISSFVNAFIDPYYHLWFVPAFLSWVILTWILRKAKANNVVLLIIGLLISIISILLIKEPKLYQNKTIALILNTYRPYYYIFFILGLLYKDLKLKRPNRLEFLLPLILFGLVIYLFYFPNEIVAFINYFVFNTLLLNLILKMSTNNLAPNNKVLEWIGINSVGIYLWHMIPIIVCNHLIGTENLLLFYLAVIVLEIIFMIIYRMLSKVSVLRKYAFGM
ncbi:acyltransferase family protein [Winogradskyella sp. 3972H.M.0a.05]|uniref:acyltransferase family protein n=1 Tax=Winogradskyella sp. 3972H.M.0a.05 TaxID=2950277 RepID=UPI0033907ACF